MAVDRRVMRLLRDEGWRVSAEVPLECSGAEYAKKRM